MFKRRHLFIFLTVLLTGCSSGPAGFSTASLSSQLAARTGFSLPVEQMPGAVQLPEGVSLDHELDLNTLALVALWNNASFKALLVDIKLAQADLEQAGLLPNPEMVYAFQRASKPYKYALELPIETLWLRPIKLNIADAEAQRVSQTLQQAGLDLIRDVRQAGMELLTMRRQAELQAQSSRLRQEIAQLTDKRLEHGDIAEPEALITRLDAARASQEAQRQGYEVHIAEQRLLLLLGLPSATSPLRIKADSRADCQLAGLDIEHVIQTASRQRPDLLAADAGIAAGRAREQLSRFNWLRVLGIADATSGQASGHELGPALRFTLPVFNWNQGNRSRASAELEKAGHMRHALLQQVEAELRQQFWRYQQGCSELGRLEQELLPQAELAESLANVALEQGDISYLAMRESHKQVIDIRLQEAMLHGTLYKTWAELERSSGHQLSRALPPAYFSGNTTTSQ